MKTVIVGFNGLVGTEVVKLCCDNNNDFIIIGGPSTKNRFVEINNQDFYSHDIDNFDYNKDYIFINCADKEQAELIATKMSNKSILIDNSSKYRLDEKVPLVIPEINMPESFHNIYANPNCSTIILMMLLSPLEKYFGIKRVVVSTYQAASGAGKNGLDELIQQTKEYCQGNELTTNFWGKQYVFNTFVHNTPLVSPYNYNEEEMKIINETKKILNRDLAITSTCIRVPVIRSHCESVNIEFNTSVTYDKIIDVLNKCEYLEILEKNFPETITSSYQNKVQVGHIREDLSLPNQTGWNFWISGDQLLRGAAYNAWLISEKIRKSK